MTEMTQGFSTPADMPGAGKWPTLKQLHQGGALLAFKPTLTKHDMPDRFNPGKTKTQVLCTVTVLELAAPISVVLDNNGQVAATLETPVQAGSEMAGYVVSQPWFTDRLADREADKSWPGLLGVIGQYPTQKGNPGWQLNEPSPAQIETATKWLAWKRQQKPATATAATPSAPQPVPASSPVQQQAAAPPWEQGAPQNVPAAPAAKPPWEQ